ncbi:hypothetical protein B7494_g8125 [Chlorociboria aeruginascens]|nr:hypothetical protein B7494_g8125 [Chlorociboria aeruginascens]
MASRRARAAAAQGASAPETQCVTHAFNINGWAVEIPRDETGSLIVPTQLNAYLPSGIQWEKAAAKMQDEGKVPWRDSTLFTARECSEEPGAGIISVLLVGFALPHIPDEALKTHPMQTKHKAVGTLINKDNLIESEETPLLVVTPISPDPEKKTDLYALLEPSLGLCTPYIIMQTKVFYLPAFRDNTTAKKERGPAWNQLVTTAAASHSRTEQLSAKQATFKKARNTTKIVLEPKASLMNEISCLTDCFLATGEVWHLKELQAVLEQAQTDLQDPPPGRPVLHKFVHNDERFEKEDPESMIEELRELWRELEIDATDILLLKEQLVQEGLYLEYRLLKPFLAEASYQLKKEQHNHKETGSIAREALATVERVLGSRESPTPILSASDERRVLPHLISTLNTIIQDSKNFDKSMKDNCGDHTMVGTLHDVWERYAAQLDTDAAKKSWFEAARYLTASMKAKERGVTEMLQDVVEIFEKLNMGN